MTKKRRDPDYTLNIFHHLDEEIKQRGIMFLVQTTKVFVSFRYEILLEDVVDGNRVRLRIVGLHAPELLMPQSGPARGWRFYTSLRGLTHVEVIKQDKSLNEFDVVIDERNITIKSAPPNPFILVSNESIPLD